MSSFDQRGVTDAFLQRQVEELEVKATKVTVALLQHAALCRRLVSDAQHVVTEDVEICGRPELLGGVPAEVRA